MARAVYIDIRAESRADAEVTTRELAEAFGKRAVAGVPREEADGTWVVNAILLKDSNDEPWCIAYREDGDLCRSMEGTEQIGVLFRARNNTRYAEHRIMPPRLLEVYQAAGLQRMSHLNDSA